MANPVIKKLTEKTVTKIATNVTVGTVASTQSLNIVMWSDQF